MIFQRYFIEKNINFIHKRLICWDHTCYCVNMVSVTSASHYITSASRYHPHRYSMYIRGQIPRNFAEIGRGSSVWKVRLRSASASAQTKIAWVLSCNPLSVFVNSILQEPSCKILYFDVAYLQVGANVDITHQQKFTQLVEDTWHYTSQATVQFLTRALIWSSHLITPVRTCL